MECIIECIIDQMNDSTIHNKFFRVKCVTTIVKDIINSKNGCFLTDLNSRRNAIKIISLND